MKSFVILGSFNYRFISIIGCYCRGYTMKIEPSCDYFISTPRHFFGALVGDRWRNIFKLNIWLEAFFTSLPQPIHISLISFLRKFHQIFYSSFLNFFESQESNFWRLVLDWIGYCQMNFIERQLFSESKKCCQKQTPEKYKSTQMTRATDLVE